MGRRGEQVGGWRLDHSILMSVRLLGISCACRVHGHGMLRMCETAIRQISWDGRGQALKLCIVSTPDYL